MSYLEVLKVEEAVKERKEVVYEGTYEEIQAQLQEEPKCRKKTESYEDCDVFLIENSETTSSILFYLQDKYPGLFYKTSHTDILKLLKKCLTVEEAPSEDESGDEEDYENYFGPE